VKLSLVNRLTANLRCGMFTPNNSRTPEAPKEHMTLLESKLLTPEQIAQGQKRAREFKPR
jgi:hypothetical protein